MEEKSLKISILLVCTFGCIFDESTEKIKKAGLFDLDFVSREEKLVEINVPNITPKEKGGGRPIKL